MESQHEESEGWAPKWSENTINYRVQSKVYCLYTFEIFKERVELKLMENNQ